MRFAKLDQLGGAGGWVRLQFATFRPRVGAVVMVDVAEQQGIAGFVHDDADIATHAHRPEVLVAGLVEPVE